MGEHWTTIGGTGIAARCAGCGRWLGTEDFSWYSLQYECEPCDRLGYDRWPLPLCEPCRLGAPRCAGTIQIMPDAEVLRCVIEVDHECPHRSKPIEGKKRAVWVDTDDGPQLTGTVDA